ncbi:DUF799 domain-containing protein [Thauera sedimentorum]|nr:DUF799 domain-containing protein [Thauera sedimentorum]
MPLVAAALLSSGCATQQPYDYTAYKESRPSSILVLPPLNMSPDVLATNSVLSHVTLPLAESGYYVFPVTLVNETFKQNGLVNPAEMHDVTLQKLRDIFGADAALYITVRQYGTTYAIISSESRVTAEARLIDLRTEQTLWSGTATASSAEGRSSSGGLVGLLVSALVHQIVESTTNRAHPIAGITSNRLLAAGRPNGILYGPRSPNYMTDGNTRP